MVSIGYVLYQKSVRLLDACAINADMCLMRNGCYGFVCVPKNSCADLINNIAIGLCRFRKENCNGCINVLIWVLLKQNDYRFLFS